MGKIPPTEPPTNGAALLPLPGPPNAPLTSPRAVDRTRGPQDTLLPTTGRRTIHPAGVVAARTNRQSRMPLTGRRFTMLLITRAGPTDNRRICNQSTPGLQTGRWSAGLLTGPSTPAPRRGRQDGARRSTTSSPGHRGPLNLRDGRNTTNLRSLLDRPSTGEPPRHKTANRSNLQGESSITRPERPPGQKSIRKPPSIVPRLPGR
jgi:hypothetical protein